MDSFEKKIIENKEAFRKTVPNREKLWESIEQDLEAAKGQRISGKVWMFLAFLILVSIALISLVTLNQITAKENVQYASSSIGQEITQISNHYGKLVSHQITLLNSNPNLSHVEKEEFLDYIKVLDQEQVELKEELNNNVDNREVLEAIIQNFQQQVNLISELLDRLDRQNFTSDDTGISI